ncbi:MAG: MBL fold metallo-hydrolase, partial [Calditrichales bacterium]
MYVKQILTGGDRNYGYLVADEETKQAMVVDPSYAPGKI